MKSEVKMTDSPSLVTDIKIWDGEGSLTQAETRKYLEYLHNEWRRLNDNFSVTKWDVIVARGLVSDAFIEIYESTGFDITIRNLESLLKLVPLLSPSPLERAMR